MTYDTRGDFRCYEIKVTKADFHSPCHNSFVGDFNYYVLPQALYEEINDEIPLHVGVWAERNNVVYCVKKAKRQTIGYAEELKSYMIRSLSREVTKQLYSEDKAYLDRLRREISMQKRTAQDYRQRYYDLLREVRELYGVRWNKTKEAKKDV